MAYMNYDGGAYYPYELPTVTEGDSGPDIRQVAIVGAALYVAYKVLL